jgi:germination protein M
VIVGYLIFNKFIVPAWERYKEKPVITKEVPYKEEEIKEVQPVPIEEMVEVNLYFSDSQAMYLIPEKRKIPQIPSLARQAVNELIKGPENSDFYRTIPEGTQVNEVYIADDIVYIDLSEEIFKNHPGGSSGELMTVYSIVNTLTEIPPIKGVQILVEGNEMESLVGHVDISMPLLRDEDWIKP